MIIDDYDNFMHGLQFIWNFMLTAKMQFQSFQIVPCGKKSFPTSLLEKGGKVRKEF